MNVSTGMSNPPLPNTTGGFASEVFGQQPHEVDRVLSRLIQDNYDVAEARRGETSPEPDLPGTWTRMDDAAVRAAGIDQTLLHDAVTGFDASLSRDASGDVVVVYAGSDEWQEWLHNFRQGMGRQEHMYNHEQHLPADAKRSFGKHD